MNYYYDDIEELEDDIYLATVLSDSDFEKKFNMDAEDRNEFIENLNEDLSELQRQKEMENTEGVDDWNQPYSHPGVEF